MSYSVFTFSIFLTLAILGRELDASGTAAGFLVGDITGDLERLALGEASSLPAAELLVMIS